MPLQHSPCLPERGGRITCQSARRGGWRQLCKAGGEAGTPGQLPQDENFAVTGAQMAGPQDRVQTLAYSGDVPNQEWTSPIIQGSVFIISLRWPYSGPIPNQKISWEIDALKMCFNTVGNTSHG